MKQILVGDCKACPLKHYERMNKNMICDHPLTEGMMVTKYVLETHPDCPLNDVQVLNWRVNDGMDKR
jgi:hypothetical protein